MLHILDGNMGGLIHHRCVIGCSLNRLVSGSWGF